MLLTAFAAALGVITTDAVLHSDTVNIHIAVPADLAKTLPKDEVLEEIYIADMEKIVETKNYFGTPEIKSSHAKTIGSVLAKALKVEDFAAAIQHQFGMKVASVNASLAVDNGKQQFVAVVSDIDEPPFILIINRENNDSLRDVLLKAAVNTMEHLSPYLTAVYYINDSDKSGDYQKADQLLAGMLVQYASSAYKKERAGTLNLAGIVALHKNDIEGSEKLFEAANDADPDLIIPQINRAFVMLLTDRDQQALEVLTPALEALKSKRDATLLAAAEMTRAAAYIALNRLDYAEISLNNAAYWDPTSALVPGLAAGLEHLKGNDAQAAVLRRKATDNLDNFETYPELASLYFKLSWKKGEPLIKNDVKATLH